MEFTGFRRRALLILMAGCLFLLTQCDNSESISSETELSKMRSVLATAKGSADTGSSDGGDIYLIGTGIHDITGPAAEIGMQGFAVQEQKTSGIHMRLRARAYIIDDGSKRVVFVNNDLWSTTQSVTQGVIKKLRERFGDIYTENNVTLSSTHTHSGPGGYSHYFLYNATILGFIEDNYTVIVSGIVSAIEKAHANLAPGKIYLNKGTVENCGWQRSPEAYAMNPESERDFYGRDTHNTMNVLKFVTTDGVERGMIAWYAVHPINVGPLNTLIHSDIHGYSSYKFESLKDTDYFAGKTFVGAFAQSTAGDVSPNAVSYGPLDGEGTPDYYTRLEENTEKLVSKAISLYNNASQAISGPLDFRHTHVDMSGVAITETGTTTCPAAMGASFSGASSEDNPSPVALFTEGITRESIDWNDDAEEAILASFVPSILGIVWPDTLDEEYIECHKEKPILIPTGIAALNTKDIPMTPQVMPLQIIRIGNFAIIAQPSEITTMAGRRLKSTVMNELSSIGITDSVIASYSNAYTSYVTTREEYSSQQYEGACTQFGPYTLNAYQQEFLKLAEAMRSGRTVDPGPTPRDLSEDQFNFTTGVVFDDKPWWNSYGDCITEPQENYSKIIGGNQNVVTAVFYGGHPRNSLQVQNETNEQFSFLTVEKLAGYDKNNDPVFITVAYDFSPETKYIWKRDWISYSKITIEWDFSNAEPGYYRIRHFGHEKSGWTGQISPYEGVTRIFSII